MFLYLKKDLLQLILDVVVVKTETVRFWFISSKHN